MKNSKINQIVRLLVFIFVVLSISLTNITTAAAGTDLPSDPIDEITIIIFEGDGQDDFPVPNVSWNS
ncbi:MAG: hypothetical protein KIH69_010705 [Anaerolineae bacterium]|nr:hypothetical protein [Anaerolineae bacterium]